jgi:hypothetical protein
MKVSSLRQNYTSVKTPVTDKHQETTGKDTDMVVLSKKMDFTFQSNCQNLLSRY